MLTKFLVYISISIVLGSNAFRSRAKRELQCGVPSNTVSLIFGGEEVERGQWPWLVAILKAEDKKFICGGVLIAKNQVLTAAHCVLKKKGIKEKLPRDILARVGAHNLSDPSEVGAISMAVIRIDIHRDWHPYETAFNADIALLTLTNNVTYSEYIHPVCLSPSGINATEGHVAGWGEGENSENTGSIPLQIKVPIVSTNECIYKNTDLAKITSLTTFCAGGQDRKGPCKGDSGGGLYIKLDGVYYVYGLVSSSLIDSNGKCDVSTFALYTSIGVLRDWIQDPKKNSPRKNQQNKNKLTCGVMSSTENELTREHFPWTVLIRLKPQNDKAAYFSTGTLISDKHVIVTGFYAADHNLVTENVYPRDPKDFELHFGLVNIDGAGASGTDSISVDGVERVTIHPDLKIGFPSFANIAILEMKTAIERSPSIFWACLTENSIDTNKAEEVYEVGWGQENNGKISKDKKSTKMKITNQGTCESSWGDYLKTVGSSKYFCAAGSEPSSSCNNKTPLYMYGPNGWTLKGLFSFSANKTGMSCDSSKAVMYEDIGPYYKWIKKQISE